MSSKDASAMGEDNNEKSAPVPRLRFPGFRAAWVSSPMSELYSFKGNNSLSRDKLNYEGGSLKNIHYGDIHTKFALHFRADAEPVPYINDGESQSTIRPENYCMAGDMVFADASEDMADIGKAIEIIDTGEVPLVSGLHTILARPNEGSFALGFGAYLFSSEGVRKQIQREGQGAKVLGLSATRLGNVRLHYSSTPDEQQRIADCLSSLDELITAETHALTAFKTHKKGLMQQLFPREGETVPRLRFPEFREAGEWEEKQIGDLQPFVTSGSRGWAAYYAEQGSLFVRITNLTRESIYLDLTDTKFVKLPQEASEGVRTQLKEFDVLISITADIGIIGYVDTSIPSPAYINQHIALVRFDTCQVCSKYVSYFLASERSQRHFNASTDVGTKAGMNLIAVQQIQLVLPTLPEQQKIVDCLSSLDDLITTQSQKIDTLKTHKKGLMQQLFPVLDEVPT